MVVEKVMFRSLRAKRGNLQLLWGSHLEIATAHKAHLAMTIAALLNSLLDGSMDKTDRSASISQQADQSKG